MMMVDDGREVRGFNMMTSSLSFVFLINLFKIAKVSYCKGR